MEMVYLKHLQKVVWVQKEKLEIKKQKRKVVEQAKEPIVKKVREVIEEEFSEEDQVQKIEIMKKKEKAKRYRNTGTNRYLLKMEESYFCK